MIDPIEMIARCVWEAVYGAGTWRTLAQNVKDSAIGGVRGSWATNKARLTINLWSRSNAITANTTEGLCNLAYLDALDDVMKPYGVASENGNG